MSSSDLVKRAYESLYGEVCPYECKLEYNGRFKGFNCSISFGQGVIFMKLSKKWRSVSEEIKVGCIQVMLNKVLKRKAKSVNIDFYYHFLKHVHSVVPKTKSDPVLVSSFDRCNEKFFFNGLERPNLVLKDGVSVLGTYNYGTDTIAISRVLLSDEELLDYVMYHEMLHKLHKFSSGSVRTVHHSRKFRESEKCFPNSAELEKRLNRLVASKRFVRKSKRFFGLLG